MTCIVGLKHNGVVYFGGDSMTSEDTYLQDGKVFSKGPYVFGGCGSLDHLNSIRYRFTPPTPPTGPQDLATFMQTTFMDSLKTILTHEDTILMVGVHGRIFKFFGNAEGKIPTCLENTMDYEATGSGAWVALGALFTIYSHHPRIRDDENPNDRIRLALEAAKNLCPTSVGGPFTFVQTPS